MQKNITLLGGKIHRATITEARLDYVGSVTIDKALMDAAGYVDYEQVCIVNLSNGSRFETYAIPGEAGSGVVCLNGGGARLALPGDLVVIMSYISIDSESISEYHPKVVFVDEKNNATKVGHYEEHGSIAD